MAKTQTRTILISSVAKAAATVLRGRWDLTAADGGILTLAITNGPTGPTGTGAIGRILIAHKQLSMPDAGAESPTDDGWKLVTSFGGGTASSTRTPFTWRFGPEVPYIEVEFPAHTGTDVTVEAIGTSYVYP